MKTLLVGAASAAIVCAVAPPARAQSSDSLLPISVSASSTLKGKKDKYAPWRAFDVDWGASADGGFVYGTAWCEGKKDEGIGEFLEIEGDDLAFSTLTVAAGFWKSPALFEKNNRPTKLKIIVADHEGNERTFDLAVPETMEQATLDAGEVLDARSIKIQFAEVAKGKMNDTCISSVGITTGDRNRAPILSAAVGAQDLQIALFALTEGFSTCNAEELSTYVKFPLSYKSLPDPTGESKPLKKKWKKAKDLLQSCGKGEVPAATGDVDYTWVWSDGPDRIQYRFAGNEAGAAVWHLWYDYDLEKMQGTWKLTAADWR